MPQATSATAPGGASIIHSYRPGGFQISGSVYEGGVLVLPETVLSWSVITLDGLHSDDFAALQPYCQSLDILLLGTGETFRFVPTALREGVRQQLGLTVDFMDTGAACRTFNMLLAENRRVAAALLPLA